MDHLISPRDPVFSKPKVRFLGRYYKGKNFSNYRHEYGISYKDIFDFQSSKIPAVEIASFLQSWLFFGLLKDIFQAEGDDFTYIEDGDAFIHTTHLDEARLNYLKTIPTKSTDVYAHFADVESKLEEGYAVLRKLYDSEDFIRQHLTPEIYLSLLLLHQYVVYAVGHGGGHFTKTHLHSFNHHINWRLETKRWCPMLIDFVGRHADMEGFYYMSNLSIQNFGDHTLCTRTSCSVDKTSNQECIPKHKHDYCTDNCRMLNVAHGELLNISQCGLTPLIVFDSNIPKNSSISVVQSHDASRYVAISHVWAHGLGNTASNALPECQLSYISKKVQDLFPDMVEPVPFWIDTLCIPTLHEEARKKAVARMSLIYSAAEMILVFDQSLLTITVQDMSLEERLLRVYVSQWMRRLWTLQEARLAKKLHFQFLDEQLDLDDAFSHVLDGYRWYQHRERVSFERLPVKGINRYLHAMKRQLRERGVNEGSTVSKMSEAVHYRSTSRPKDEAVCLGTLWGLDMEKILSVPEREQMLQVWKLLDEKKALEHSIICCPGPKVDIEGFGWAPKTLLSPKLKVGIGEKYSARLSDRGLNFNCPGFILPSVQLPKQNFTFQTDRGNCFNCIFLDDENSTSDRVTKQETPWIASLPPKVVSMAIVIDIRRLLDTSSTSDSDCMKFLWREEEFPWNPYRLNEVQGALCFISKAEKRYRANNRVEIRFHRRVAVGRRRKEEETFENLGYKIQDNFYFRLHQSAEFYPRREINMNFPLLTNMRCHFRETQQWCCL